MFKSYYKYPGGNKQYKKSDVIENVSHLHRLVKNVSPAKAEAQPAPAFPPASLLRFRLLTEKSSCFARFCLLWPERLFRRNFRLHIKDYRNDRRQYICRRLGGNDPVITGKPGSIKMHSAKTTPCLLTESTSAGSAFPAAWNTVVNTRITPAQGMETSKHRSIRLPEAIIPASFMKSPLSAGHTRPAIPRIQPKIPAPRKGQTV